MSEDFNGLLNALRRGNDINPNNSNPSNPWYVSPNMPMPQQQTVQAAALPQQPQQLPPLHPYMYLPPPQQQAPVEVKTSSSWINYLIAILLLAIITLGIIAWMRMTRLETVNLNKQPIEEKEKEKKVFTNSEIRTNLKADTRELPVPATLSPLYEAWPNDNEVAQAVTESLLEYVKPIPSKDIVEVKEEVVLEEIVSKPKKRLVADESEEVKEYIKKRENLFN